jgi:hypothetical protein
MPISCEDVLRIVSDKGPIIPNDIRKTLGEPDSTLINVYLADLVAAHKTRKTTVKLGASSFYYTNDHKTKLEDLVEHLGEKDRRTANLLKEQGVLDASKQDPLTRVSLANIPDFAVPVKVKTSDGEKQFYRWFLLDSEEAKRRIQETLPKTTTHQPSTPEVIAEKKPESEKPVERQKELSESSEPPGTFVKLLKEYFKAKNIRVQELKETRKDSDVECVVKLPTPVGEVAYFCKAKNKKTSNDGDLASAILLARKKMLPALYITTGSVTAKAKEAPELQECLVVEIGRRD